MRLVVFIIDIAILLTLLFFGIADYSSEYPEYSLGYLIGVVLLLINILAIRYSFKIKESWLTLFIKRKALEEKNKIDKLTKE